MHVTICMSIYMYICVCYNIYGFAGNRRRQNKEFDSHVIAGVLISALKDMNLPLLHELFDDILEIGKE